MEYIVSARKYRPISFDAVVGQQALTATLKNAVKSGKLAHAYLFCGPRGVGKTTCARIFARAINCQNPTQEGEACGECESCKAFQEQRSYNIFELDAASNNTVEDIKTLMEQTHIPPQVGKYKVFIIDEVHMLSAAAFNAFLKTLEEPPAHMIFILATTEKHKLLPTIISRCQIYDFERMNVKNTVEHLKMVAQKEGVSYEEEALSVIAEKADGGMRDALSIFDQVASFCQGNITYDKVIEDLNVLDSDNYFKIVDLSLENKPMEVMMLLNEVVSRGFDPGNVAQGLASHMRNVLLARSPETTKLLEVSDQQRQRLVEQAKKCGQKFLFDSLKLLNQCDVAYRQSSNKRLLVELTLIQVAQLTQPEDQDTPASGRSPKRLKILFQKLLQQAQEKKAVQQVTAPENDVVQGASRVPDGSMVVPGGSMVVPGGSMVVPGGSMVVPGGSMVVPGGSMVVPGGSMVVPGGSMVVKGGQKISLANIGPTFSGMKKAEKAEKVEEVENVEKADNIFTQQDLSREWLSMCNRMMQLQNMKAIAMRMKNVQLKILEFPNVEATMDSQQLCDTIKPLLNRVQITLRKTLKNSNIQIVLRVTEMKERKPKMTDGQLFEYLKEHNPEVKRLVDELGLELAI